MDYISVEEFKKQSDKVQENLLNWWKENIERHDMFYRKSKDRGYCWSGRQKYIVVKVKGYELETITLRNREISAGRDAWTEKWNIQNIYDIVPLLMETKLRKFIEEKTNSKLFYWFDGGKMHFYIGYFINNEYNTKELLEIGNIDLLKAYYQIAIKIAEKEN